MSELNLPIDNTTESELTADEVYRILSNRRRRDAIQFIDMNGSVSKRELAEFVAFLEYGSDFSNEQRRRLWISLYQSHLPELERNGLVNVEDEVVESTDALPAIRELIEYVDWSVRPVPSFRDILDMEDAIYA